jgi:hypothetical protein
MSKAIQLTTSQPIEVLATVFTHFTNRADVSFEGDISHIDWSDLLDARVASTRQKVTVPLSSEAVSFLTRSVLPRIGLRSRVQHVIVADGERRLFAAYDCFGDRMVVIESPDQEELLSLLQERNLVKEYTVVEIEGR